MKQSSIINSVRAELSQLSANTTIWPDTTLRSYILDGITQLRLDVPSLALANDGTLYPAPDDVFADGADLPLDGGWRNALVVYLLHRCFSKDSEDARDLERSRAYFTQYQAMIGG